MGDRKGEHSVLVGKAEGKILVINQFNAQNLVL
jgi:hypothetical protein